MNATPPTLSNYSSWIARLPQAGGGYRRSGRIPEPGAPALVSIITVTFNAANTLPRVFKSLRAQTYRNIEHIVVDGGSRDGTLDLIRAEQEQIAVWCSEPDGGIYDAFNKGIAMASGEFVGILNADDYYERDQIEFAVAALERTGAPFVHGDIVMHGWQGRDVEIPGDPDYASKIRERMPSLHQVTTLCRRSVFAEYGLFLTTYRIAGDFEWYLRLAKRGCIGAYDPQIKAHMSAGGISTTQQRKAFREALLIVWRHGLPLHRALRVTLPRLMFPNGTPPFLARVLNVLRRPRTATGYLVHWGRTLRRISCAGSRIHAPRRPLLPAFLEARQQCLTIDALGLEWLYGAGQRARNYAVISSDPEAKVVAGLLESAGALACSESADVDVVVIDRERLEHYDFRRNLEHCTFLVTSPALDSFQVDAELGSLNFGGVRALGLLVNPAASLR